MPSAPSTTTATFSDDELHTLRRLLAAHASLDHDGLMGFFHAVAVAPTRPPPSVWLPVLLPAAPSAPDDDAIRTLIALVMRQYNEVAVALEGGAATTPAADAVDACASFARGYIVGALLDPEWISDDNRWALAAPIAYLAGEHALVPRIVLAELAQDVTTDPKATARRAMGKLIVDTSRMRVKWRKPPPPAPEPSLGNTKRIGMNDPCPCGSGKPFQLCCAGKAEPPG